METVLKTAVIADYLFTLNQPYISTFKLIKIYIQTREKTALVKQNINKIGV